MAKLVRFLDDDQRGRWANVMLDSGDPIWIGIAQSGISVKKSKIGLFGPKLYEQSNVYLAAKTAAWLWEHNQSVIDLSQTKSTANIRLEDLTPPDMVNPVLKSIVNVVLHCENAVDVSMRLNEADRSSNRLLG